LQQSEKQFLKPRVFNEFLQKYDSHQFPRADLAQNVLEDMGVPRDKTEGVLSQIDASARSVGFLDEIKDKVYVTLQGATAPKPADNDATGDPEPEPEPDNRQMNQSLAVVFPCHLRLCNQKALNLPLRLPTMCDGSECSSRMERIRTLSIRLKSYSNTESWKRSFQ